MRADRHQRSFDRRHIMRAGAALILCRAIDPALATPDGMAAAMRRELGETPVTAGRVRLEIPQLAENGNAVGLTIDVESPMTAADHVATIHVFSERNPLPDVVRFHLTPRAGRAHVETVIRLAQTQRIVAVARMSDGTCWSGAAEVVVTMGGCLDPT